MNKILEETTDCCGCNACVQVCPTKAISLHSDKYGFVYPTITPALCVDCKRCQSVCPSINNFSDQVTPKVLSAYANNESKREKGSSGGIFGLLAEQVLQKGGFVYGAALDENLKLKHIEVSSVEDLPLILKSKYIQSEIGSIFLLIKKRISQGENVLFCGTPCQCLALFNFLGKKRYDNLILIDFICHGVPSQVFFDKAIMSYENRRNTKVNFFSFRHKSLSDKTEAGLRHFYLRTKDGAIESGRSVKFPFYSTYLRYLFFRPSCYKCSYAKVERCTDITLGDFWGLNKLEGLTDFNKGYSMLVINTERGRELVRSLDVTTKEYKIDVAINNNFAYTHPTIQTPQSKAFFNDYDILSWKKLEEKYMIIEMDLFHRGLRFIGRIIKKIK